MRRLCIDRLGLGLLRSSFASVRFLLHDDAILTEVLHNFVENMTDLDYVAQIRPVGGECIYGMIKMFN